MPLSIKQTLSLKEIKDLSLGSLIIRKEELESGKLQQIEGENKDYAEGEVLVKYKNNKINLQTVLGRTTASDFIRSKSLEKEED